MMINNYIQKLLVVLIAGLVGFLLEGMDPPGLIFVKTNDEKMVAIEEWMVPEMKTLLVLWEHQTGKNNSRNPLELAMINEQELVVLTDALNAIKKNVFEEFLENLAEKEGISINIREIGRGEIRKLINATQIMQAINLNTAITTYFLPPEDEEKVKKNIVQNITPLLRQEMINKTLRIFPDVKKTKAFRKAFSCCNNQKIIICDSQDSIRICNIDNPMNCVKVTYDSNTAITPLDYSPKTNKMLLQVNINRPNINHGLYMVRLLNFHNSNGVIQNLAIDEDLHPWNGRLNDQGDKAVICCNSPVDNLFICDANTGEVIHNLKGHSDPVIHAIFNKQGDKIISCSYGVKNNLILWNALTGEKIFTLDGHQVDVYNFAFSPDGNFIVSRDAQNNFKLWDTMSGKSLYGRLFDNKDWVYFMFNENSNKLYLNCYNKTYRLIVLNLSNKNDITELTSLEDDKIVIDPVHDKVITINSQYFCTLLDFSGFNFKKDKKILATYALISYASFSPDGRKMILDRHKDEHCDIFHTNDLKHPIIKLGKSLKFSWINDSSWLFGQTYSSDIEDNVLVKIDFTAEDKKNIAKIVDLPLEQVRLINQMALAKSRGKKELNFTNKDLKLFYALPTEIKEFLPQTLCPRIPQEKDLMGEPKMGYECAIF